MSPRPINHVGRSVTEGLRPMRLRNADGGRPVISDPTATPHEEPTVEKVQFADVQQELMRLHEIVQRDGIVIPQRRASKGSKGKRG